MAGSNSIDVKALLDKVDGEAGVELFRTLLTDVLQVLLEAERDQHVGVSRYERSPDRADTRSGYKPRRLRTIVGDLELQRPQTRLGMESGLLSRYDRIDQSVLTMAAEMYAHGVTTRKVEALLERTVGTDISPASVSKANAMLDAATQALRERPLGSTPVLIADARFDKVRRDGAVKNTALLTAIGVDENGFRRVLDFMAIESETKAAWKEAFRRLKKRGVHDVRFVVSDDHEGLRDALEEEFVGAVWQRCQTHVSRNVLDQTPKAHRKEVQCLLRDVCNAPDEAEARRRLRELALLADQLKPGLGEYIERTVEEALAVFALPPALRVRLRTTNMLERVHEEIKRRTRVSRLFPSMASYERCAGTILVHTDERWQQVGRRYLNVEELIEALDTGPDGQVPRAA